MTYYGRMGENQTEEEREGETVVPRLLKYESPNFQNHVSLLISPTKIFVVFHFFNRKIEAANQGGTGIKEITLNYILCF